MIIEPVANHCGEVTRGGLLVEIFDNQWSEALKLSDHRGNDEIKNSGSDQSHKDKSDDDGYDTGGYMKFELHELHHGIEQIGNQPTNEEWEQNSAEFADKQVKTYHSNGHQGPSGSTVECDFSCNHRVGFSCDGDVADVCCSCSVALR